MKILTMCIAFACAALGALTCPRAALFAASGAEPGQATCPLDVRLAGSKAGWPISFNRSFELVLYNPTAAPIKLMSVCLTTPRALYESCVHARLTAPPPNEASGSILVQSSDIYLTSNDSLKPGTIEPNQSVTLRFLVNPTPHGDLVQFAPFMDPACWLNGGESDAVQVELRTADQVGKAFPVVTREVQLALYPPPAAILLGLILGSVSAAVIPWFLGGKPEEIPASFAKAFGVGFVGFLFFFLADAPAFPLQVKFNIYGGFLLGISGTSLIGYFVSLLPGGDQAGAQQRDPSPGDGSATTDGPRPSAKAPPAAPAPVVLQLPPTDPLDRGDAPAPAGGAGADADDHAGRG